MALDSGVGRGPAVSVRVFGMVPGSNLLRTRNDEPHQTHAGNTKWIYENCRKSRTSTPFCLLPSPPHAADLCSSADGRSDAISRTMCSVESGVDNPAVAAFISR